LVIAMIEAAFRADPMTSARGADRSVAGGRADRALDPGKLLLFLPREVRLPHVAKEFAPRLPHSPRPCVDLLPDPRRPGERKYLR